MEIHDGQGLGSTVQESAPQTAVAFDLADVSRVRRGYRVCAIARSFRGRRGNWQGHARSVKDSFDKLHMQERVCLLFAAIRVVVVEAWLVEGGCAHPFWWGAQVAGVRS